MKSHIKDYPLIILAAGKSQRMGFPKGLLEYKSKYLLQQQIETFLMAGGETILMVVGEDKAQYLEKMPNLESNVIFIHNDNYDLGPFYSIQLAVKAFIEPPGYFIQPIDVLPPNENLYLELLSHKEEVVIPTFDGKGGHPTLIRNGFATKLLFYKEGRLDEVIHNYKKAEVIRVQTSEENVISNKNS
jgi:molybdenum cofactor cytidylyltransferase